jgi:hypothetical protein
MSNFCKSFQVCRELALQMNSKRDSVRNRCFCSTKCQYNSINYRTRLLLRRPTGLPTRRNDGFPDKKHVQLP